MNDLNTKEVSDICVSCGMCCDGTLFGRGNILNEADNELISRIGIEIIEFNGIESFKQPCNQFKGCCTIYDKPRPGVCNSFFCDPLKKAQKKEISIEVANGIILKALNLKNEILDLAFKFEDFQGLDWRRFMKKIDPIIEESHPENLKKFGILIIKIAIFKTIIKDVYTAKKNETIELN
jgi:uncharacterized protein